VLALIQDIQQRKETEEERGKLQERLFQAQKDGGFLGLWQGGLRMNFNNLLGLFWGLPPSCGCA